MSSSHNARTNTPIRSNFYRPIFYPNSLSHLLTRILTISIDVLCVQNTWKSAWRRRHGEAVVRSVSFARRSRVDAWRDDRQRRCSQRWNYCRVWTERHTEWCRPPWRRCRSNVILQPSQHKVTRDRRVWYDARHPFCIISGVVGQNSRTALPYLTLPYLRGGRLHYCTIALGWHTALRPQHAPSAHPRQTSRSIEPLWSFGKPQEKKPMDVTAAEAAEVASVVEVRLPEVTSGMAEANRTTESCKFPKYSW